MKSNLLSVGVLFVLLDLCCSQNNKNAAHINGNNDLSAIENEGTIEQPNVPSHHLRFMLNRIIHILTNENDTNVNMIQKADSTGELSENKLTDEKRKKRSPLFFGKGGCKGRCRQERPKCDWCDGGGYRPQRPANTCNQCNGYGGGGYYPGGYSGGGGGYPGGGGGYPAGTYSQATASASSVSYGR